MQTPMNQKDALKRKSPTTVAGLVEAANVTNGLHQGSLYFRGRAK
jgi:hypothetical protein